MNNFNIDIIGIIAGTLTTVSFIPQIIKIYRTKHARDISLAMYVVFTAGVSFWLVYGILLAKLPIILANGIALFFSAMIIAAKIAWRNK
jgi:MtN3 and saliva related transmembrane protein